MLTEQEKIDTLTRLGIQLNEVRDLDMLMERLLVEARRFVNADAGSIYICEGESLSFTYTQNDTLQARLKPTEKLIYNTFSMPIDKKSIAGFSALTGEMVNIKDAYQIPEDRPFHFSPAFDDASDYKTHSMLTVPLKTSKGVILGILQVINALDHEKKPKPFTINDEKIMSHFASISAVALERAQMTRSILLRMIRMAEMRDPKETGAHVNRVGGYAVEIYEQWAKRRSLSSDEIDKNKDVLRMAAMLHDVGKVAISDLILKKPGRFNEEEFEIMKTHTVVGAQLFMHNPSDLDEAAMQVALNHHERWDGNGYPGHVDVGTGAPVGSGSSDNAEKAIGKKADEIPLYGRIVALADVYDALCSSRIYKEAWDEKDVLDLIKKDSGTHFDPELVEIFFENYDVIRSIRQRYSD